MDCAKNIWVVGNTLNDSKNDEGECFTSHKDHMEEVTIKKEPENYLENFSEFAVKQEVEIDFPVVKESPGKEDPFELTKEKIMLLEDFEFRSVGPSTSTSTGIINCKVEDYDHDDTFQEEEMNCPVATDNSAPEEDPLELNYNMHENVFEHHSKLKIKKLMNNEPGSPVESQNRGLKYRCHYCQKMFDNSSDVNDHLQVHRGERPYSCNHCEKSFSNIFVFKCHLSIHTEIKPFMCTHCERSFSLLSSLKNHLRIHSGEKQYVCTHCQKSFSVLSHLKLHLRMHSGEKPFTCQHCQRSFSDISNLKKHLRIHTGEKPFTCQYCQRSFSLRSTLNNHLRTHTGERPFTCQHCQKSFSTWSTLKNHSRIHSR